MFEEKKIIDRIEIINFEVIQVRKINKIYKDGNEIAVSHERTSYMRDQSMYGENPVVLNIAKAIWPGYDGSGALVQSDSGSVK